MTAGRFDVDLDELNTLANTNIPYIEKTCSDAETTLKTNAQHDAAIFDETANSTLYLDVATTFAETRADLENLLDALSSSLEECAKALREIHRRYQDADENNSAKLKKIGMAL
ncbi:hypothetical protein [Amycolatopsis taiwanensis]|uniref:Uncharacterized protein n=1 Tax=Amycolatopsis taiwanensis TaxID=342230 RepID=A0A9W6VKD5_9PSEU|nr:hypothetical protein [Amycolatopsis taiwanensis]GLY70494.1 hypothetical protein Atai01_71130 [Amycolatopsis taiwanensis]